MLLVTAQEMRALDRATIDDVGVPGIALMENAGRATADLIWRRAGLSPGRRVAVLCGGGNNGGDGFVVARHLANRSCVIEVFLLAREEGVTGDARTNLLAWRRQGGELTVCADAAAFEAEERGRVAFSDVRVDALLGTGLNSEVRGVYRAGVELLNSLAGGFTAAVDIPSGLHADTGQPLGAAVRADLTATYGYAKRGHVLSPGSAYVGRLEVVDIGIPPALAEAAGIACSTVEEAEVRAALPLRPLAAHKGTFGHLLVVAGRHGKSGAAVLACEAALRTGAGLVTLVSDDPTRQALVTVVPEAMSEPARGPGDLAALAVGRTAIACGPGIGTDEEAAARVRFVAADCPLPAVLDADALNVLAAGRLDWLALAAAPRILTPHPGEMARLTKTPARVVQADRIGAAAAFAREHGVVVVLKGAGTVVAEPSGRVRVVTTGGPALATGGSGDVLTGIIGGLLAQGVPPAEAAAAGAWLHGAAGDLAADDLGAASVLAGDVTACLASVLGG